MLKVTEVGVFEPLPLLCLPDAAAVAATFLTDAAGPHSELQQWGGGGDGENTEECDH